jgi:hypothetical protein
VGDTLLRCGALPDAKTTTKNEFDIIYYLFNRILPLVFSMKSMNCNNRLNAFSSREVNNSIYLRILKLLITLIFLLATS